MIKTTVFLGFFLVIIGCKEKSVKPEIVQHIPQEIFAVDGITINDPKTEENLSLFILT